VITVLQTDELALERMAGIAPVMRAHFQGDLYRRRAIRTIAAMPQARWSECAQTFRKLHHRLMRKACQHHMLQRPQLLDQSRVDARVTMPEQIHPPGTHRIQITLAVIVNQPNALAARDGQQRKIFVMLHLRTRVPDGGETASEQVGIVWSVRGHARNHNGFTLSHPEQNRFRWLNVLKSRHFKTDK
jgi:hypothetical protein